MTATQTVGRGQLAHVLEDSVEQRRRAVLTHHSDAGWRTFKATFADGSAVGGRLTLHLLAEDAATETLPDEGELMGVTFRVGHKKCMFGAPVLSIRAAGDVSAITLGWPDEIQQLQRRAYERVAPPNGQVVAVRIWRDDPASDARRQAVRHGQLEDISAGGMRVRVSAPEEIELGATYRCALTPRPGKPAIVLDALARHREAADQGRAAIGFQFVGLEASNDGRRTLDRLAKTVAQFQRGRSRGRRPNRPRRSNRS